jgi:vesicle-fusing ATPase
MDRPLKLEVRVTSSPDNSLALTNQVFLNPKDVELLSVPPEATSYKEKNYLIARDQVYTFRGNDKIGQGLIGLSSIQRQNLNVSLNEKLSLATFIPDSENVFLASIKLEVDFLSKSKKPTEKYDAAELKNSIIQQLEQQIFTIGQKFVIDFRGTNLLFKVLEVQTLNLQEILKPAESRQTSSGEGSQIRGILIPQTDINFEKAMQSQITLTGTTGVSGQTKIFRPDWKFESMGIGGLDKEFADIFRRAFASRVFPPSVVSKLGIQHVRGILLFGPPGTGKTLMARQIGKMLCGKEPKIVNGPEILNKYVGQSEENIRNLFKDAEAEYRLRGDDSDLHIIIFDELDAICRARGSRNDGTGVGDTVVNQLLAKIDGVESLNNILLIGMTNRKELIDEALLRPGRLEVHMEISLPDESGRLQILRIHTSKMRANNYMGEDVDLLELAELTKNFSGAEIEGLVKNATSFAFSRQLDAKNLTKPIDPEKIKVSRADFMQALTEIKPAFGADNDDFANCVRNGIINYGPNVEKVLRSGRLFTQQVRNSERTPLVSILLDGTTGSGKTALAATLAKESDFPFMRLLSPETLVGYSEAAKCAKITKVFEDSYKSPFSVIVVDDIERILEYVPIGPRFSNAILQTLLVLMKKIPPKGRKLLIIGTTSNKEVLAQMDFMDCFNATINVPVITTRDEFKQVLKELQAFDDDDTVNNAAISFTSERITIKKMIMITELALQGDKSGALERFVHLMTEHSIS